MMKVVVVSVRKASNVGGAEVVWQNLKTRGFSFVNFSLDDEDLPLWVRRVPELFHLREIVASKWLLSKAVSVNPSVIVYDKIFGWRKVNSNAKLVCFNHGSYTLAGLTFKRKNFFVYLFYKYVIGFVEKRSYHNADRIIAVSESVKKEMVEYFNVPEERVRVINNGVDLKRFKRVNNKVELRKKYGLPLNKRLILFPGRPSFGKGFDVAEKVLDKLGSDYFMFVLGEGESKDNLKFIGKVPNEEMVELYNCADLCLFPSRYEGNSLSVLESAACGTPLVLSRTGLMKSETVMDEFVCDTVDEYVEKIKNLFTDGNLMRASEKWSRFSKKFSVRKQLLEIKRFLKELEGEK